MILLLAFQETQKKCSDVFIITTATFSNPFDWFRMQIAATLKLMDSFHVRVIAEACFSFFFMLFTFCSRFGDGS